MAESYHHGNLRQELINKGLEVLEETGLEELSLRALAESLGVSKTAPYRHFATKRDLLTALAAEGYQLFADAMEEGESKFLDDDGRPRIDRVYRIFGAFAQKRPELYRLMFSSLGNSLHSERCRLNAQRAFSVLIRLADHIEFSGKDPRPIVLSMWAKLHGWVLLLLDDLIPPDIGVSWENWEDFVLGDDYLSGPGSPR